MPVRVIVWKIVENDLLSFVIMRPSVREALRIRHSCCRRYLAAAKRSCVVVVFFVDWRWFSTTTQGEQIRRNIWLLCSA